MQRIRSQTPGQTASHPASEKLNQTKMPSGLRLPRQAAWFLVIAPPILALIFDPSCSKRASNMFRAWLVVMLTTLAVGALVHFSFAVLEKQLAAQKLWFRLVAHALLVATVTAFTVWLLFPFVSWVYPEVGADLAPVLWRTELVAFVYVSAALLFGEMQRRSELARAEAQREQQSALEARLAQLQAQLAPHFLFNSLNVCAGLVHTSPNVAESTIDKLSAFLRYSLETGTRKTVPLADELDAMHAYLDVQRERFGEHLQHQLEVGFPLSLAPQVPPLVLQPLLENAVLHGCDAQDGGAIRISCSLDAQKLTMVVENNVVEESRSMRAAYQGTGTGQRNVRERLQALYGDQAKLVCEQRGARYVASISLPINP